MFGWFKRTRMSRQTAAQVDRAVVHAIEQLEGRRHLSVSCSVSSGTLSVYGDSNSNDISISESGGSVSVYDGSTLICSESNINEIFVFGGEGNDTISGSGITSAMFRAYGGDGNDAISGGQGSNSALYGEEGDDDFYAEDSSPTYIVGGNGEDRAAYDDSDYADVEQRL